MCCFSIVTPLGWLGRLLWARPLRVEGTRIFARSLGREQGLVYALDLSVARDVAMILPLPVDPAAGEGGLTFVDLSGYPEFFTDLAVNFEAFKGDRIDFRSENKPASTDDPAARCLELRPYSRVVPLNVVEWDARPRNVSTMTGFASQSHYK